MEKIKNILMLTASAIGAFLLLVIQSKNRKIEKQQDQIKQHESKNEELQFINNQEKKAKDDKDVINTSNESDVDRLLEQNKAYRD